MRNFVKYLFYEIEGGENLKAYIDTSDSPQPLKDYLNYISTIKNRSQLTVINYYTDLKMFIRYLMITYNVVDKKTEFSEIDISKASDELIKNATLNDAIGFLNFTIDNRNNHAKARFRKAVALRQFYKYLTDKKAWYSASPMRNLELPSPKNALPKHLTLNETAQLLNMGFENMDNWQDYRDFAMTIIFLNCGIRLSELVGLNSNDVIMNIDYQDKDNPYYSIKVLGKGNKERIVYLNDQCVTAIKNYTKLRPEFKGENALFVSKQGKRISARRVEQIINARIENSGLAGKGISVHKLRHTAATLMYQNGVDVRVLKEVLGHESLNTTQIYTHVVNQQMRDAINNNPVAEVVKVEESSPSDEKPESKRGIKKKKDSPEE